MQARKPETLIQDADDWCRACGGRGGVLEDNGYGQSIFSPCHICRGSGRRTVRVASYEPPAGCM